MNNLLITIVGSLAATLVAIRVIPQVIKGYKTKSVEDVSNGWLWVGLAGALMWTIYGILITDNIIIIGNSVAVLSYVLIAHQKIIYKIHILRRR